MNFLIIGGDAAGMSAASRAKRNMPDLDVTVLEKSPDVSYSACGLPYNIADPDRDMDDLVVRRAEVFRSKQGIERHTGHNAMSIDPGAKIVAGAAGDGREFEFPYDRLLIATGASPILPDIPGVGLPGVMALKTLDDGRRIKEYIKTNNVKKVVICGMGYIGLEMCEALRARSIDVEMVKPGPVLLPWMPGEMSDVVGKEAESNGVALRAGRAIQKIEKRNGSLDVLAEGGEIEAGMVLVAMGVRPKSEIAASAGLETGVDNAIAVDRALRTSDNNIFAAGDCADAYHVVTGEKTWIPLALRANRAGWAVADNVIGKKMELPGIAGTAVFKFFQLEIARTGLTLREAEKHGFDPVSVVSRTSTRAHAHPGSSDIWAHMVGDKKSGRLLGAQMVGREGAAHRINAPAVALHSKMTVEQYSQSDLAYAPPFGPVWDPTLTAANQLLKKL